MKEMSSFAALQRENSLLTQKNQQLNSDLQTLQKQFNSAVEVSSSFELINKKNEDLLNQIHKINDEKEDLQRRLQIAMRNIEEQKEKLLMEQQKTAYNQTNEIESLKLKINDERKDYQLQIAKLHDRIASIEEDSKKKDLELKHNDTELNSIFKASSKHFDKNVKDAETLIKLLLIPPTSTNQTAESFSFENSSILSVSGNNEIKENKDFKYKKKVKKQILQLKKELIEQQKSNDDLRKELEKSYNQKVNELTYLNEELKNKMERLNNENDSLKSKSFLASEENSQLKIQMQCLKNDQESQSLNKLMNLNDQIKKLTKQLNESEKLNENLKNQIGPLLTKLHNLDKQNKALLKQNDKYKSVHDSTIDQNDKLLHENELLSQQSNETQSRLIQITKRTNDLQTITKQLQSSINEKDGENQKLQLTIETLQKANDIQNDEILTQKAQIENLSQMLKVETEKSHELSISLHRMEQNCKNLEDDVKLAHEKLVKANEPMESVMLLPLSVWSIPELPNEIVECVQDVVNNQTLKTPTKVRQVLSIVCKYFLSKNERNEFEIKELQEKEIKITNNLQNLSNFMAKLFPEIPCKFDDIHENQILQQNISDVITGIRKSMKNAIDIKNKLDKQILDLLLYLNVDTVGDAISTIHEMNETIARLEKSENKLNNRICDMKNKYESLRDDFSHEISELQVSIENQQQQFEQLQDKNSQLNQEINQLNLQIEKNQEKYQFQLRENEIVFNAKISEYSKQNSFLHEQLNSLKAENISLFDTIENQKKEISKHTNTIQLLRRNKKNLLNQIEQITSTSEEKNKEQKQQIQQEREIFEKRITEETAIFQKRISEMSELYEKMKQKTVDLENLNSNLNLQISDLTLRIQKSELRYNTFTKEVERDKLISNSQHHSEILLLKDNYQDKLAEKDSQIMNEKRTIMSFVALQFCSLFDANVEMNEANFNTFIQTIRSRLMNLLSCDAKLRNLLQIGPNQSIVDCVSQLLLSSPQMLAKY
ncbi:hypothetical protein TRFO_01476 [Tritrichomonas foetus]|uniref:Uncharacterized protein n=1 Tax=Tritrichomonas foetus TaxID=1144522 RepID=A0A1J4K236_9EUKA|nr:hypothetical protein TRFO_01476 [Tritrichomonas foetus]|eukprot:OHT03798.1 hypothetical protein TRFO_01476 [Tritrichomonas foetus]